MTAVLYRPGEGERLAAAGSEILLKATGEQTAGSFFLSETTLAPGFPGPPLHRHDTLHDMFYVLEGTLRMRLEDEEVDAEAGTFVCVPPGVAHTFSNPSPTAVRVLNFNTPSGFEHYMRELAEAMRSGPMSSEEIGRIASRHDFHAV
jgi:mannose-6-phosphate isomerase-like protein (cupin superfamily)